MFSPGCDETFFFFLMVLKFISLLSAQQLSDSDSFSSMNNLIVY